MRTADKLRKFRQQCERKAGTSGPGGGLLTPQSPRVYLLGESLAHCAVCGKPMRGIHSSCGQKHMYYRCASWLRNEPCTASRQQIREDLLSVQLEPYIAMLHLPDDWRKRAEELVASDTSMANIEKRRNDLRGQLRRLNYQFEQGLIEEADVPTYQKKAQNLIREINSIVIPDAGHIHNTGEQLIAFATAWAKADKAHRHAMLKEMFDAVYIDTDNKLIVGVKPYAEFVPLFRQTNLVERDCMFVLKNEETSESGGSSGELAVSGGRDGRRIIARLLICTFTQMVLLRFTR